MVKIIKTDAEWRLKLSELAYKVTRKHGTERPFSNDNFPKVNGIFLCVLHNKMFHQMQVHLV